MSQSAMMEKATAKLVKRFLADFTRTHSPRTIYEYRRILGWFFRGNGKAFDKVVDQDVHTFAYGRGPSGKEPAPATTGLRITATFVFYDWLEQMGLYNHNPASRVRRPRRPDSRNEAYSAEEIGRALAGTPDTPAGKRDHILIRLFYATGRKRVELLGLRKRDIEQVNGTISYNYRWRGSIKRREFPPQLFHEFLRVWTVEGRPFDAMCPDDILFSVSVQGFYLNFRRYRRNAGLSEGGVEVLRQSAARAWNEAGEPLRVIAERLDLSSLDAAARYCGDPKGDRQE